MRTPIAAATVLLALAAAAPPAQAATYQTGAMSYAVSGSWTSTTTGRDSCSVVTGPDRSQYQDYTYTVTERGTFSSGRGVAGYQGNVGSEPFFTGRGDRPARLTVRSTLSVNRSVACKYTEDEDCGTRTIKGVARSQFEGPARRARPISLHVTFADSANAFDLRGPFKTCAGEGGGTDLLNAMARTDDSADLQAKALRYPSVKAFWSRKARTMRGTARAGGDTFSMTMKTSRRTLSSKRSLHP